MHPPHLGGLERHQVGLDQVAVVDVGVPVVEAHGVQPDWVVVVQDVLVDAVLVGDALGCRQGGGCRGVTSVEVHCGGLPPEDLVQEESHFRSRYCSS